MAPGSFTHPFDNIPEQVEHHPSRGTAQSAGNPNAGTPTTNTTQSGEHPRGRERGLRRPSRRRTAVCRDPRPLAARRAAAPASGRDPRRGAAARAARPAVPTVDTAVPTVKVDCPLPAISIAFSSSPTCCRQGRFSAPQVRAWIRTQTSGLRCKAVGRDLGCRCLRGRPRGPNLGSRPIGGLVLVLRDDLLQRGDHRPDWGGRTPLAVWAGKHRRFPRLSLGHGRLHYTTARLSFRPEDAGSTDIPARLRQAGIRSPGDRIYPPVGRASWTASLLPARCPPGARSRSAWRSPRWRIHRRVASRAAGRATGKTYRTQNTVLDHRPENR